MFVRIKRKIKNYLNEPYWTLGEDMMKLCPRLMSDKFYMSIRHKQLLGYEIDWDNPKTFSEKLQWLKLHDRKPIYTTMVDKYEAKRFIADKIGEQFVIPTLGVWRHFNEIDFGALPNQFVLKCNHDSGSVVLCEDKVAFDYVASKIKLEKALKQNFYWKEREWPYRNVKPKIIAEPLLKDGTGAYLRDYKFYTFGGLPKFFYTTSNRGGEGGLYEDFFDLNGVLLPWGQNGSSNNPNTPIVPANIEKMVSLARILSKGTSHLRVDFYEIMGRIYIGELTFFDGAGFVSFTPEEYNGILGDWIKLPTDK